MHWTNLVKYVYRLMKLAADFEGLSPKKIRWVQKQAQEIRTWLPVEIRKVATVDVVIALIEAVYRWAREGGKRKPKKKR